MLVSGGVPTSIFSYGVSFRPSNLPLLRGPGAHTLNIYQVATMFRHQNIYLHEWLISMVHVGKYTSPMDPISHQLLWVRIPPF